jgi:hypothetical protein
MLVLNRDEPKISAGLDPSVASVLADLGAGSRRYRYKLSVTNDYPRSGVDAESY